MCATMLAPRPPNMGSRDRIHIFIQTKPSPQPHKLAFLCISLVDDKTEQFFMSIDPQVGLSPYIMSQPLSRITEEGTMPFGIPVVQCQAVPGTAPCPYPHFSEHPCLISEEMSWSYYSVNEIFSFHLG